MRNLLLFHFWGVLAALLAAPAIGWAQQGEYAWAVSAGGTGYDSGQHVGSDAAGNSYMTGLFQGTARFGTLTLTAQTDQLDIYLAKYSPQGQVLWVRQISGPNSKSVNDLAVDPAGNAVLTGRFSAPGLPPAASSTLTFGALQLTSGSIYGEMYTARYDALGQVLWANQTRGLGPGAGTKCGGQDLALDPDGNTYLTGYYGSGGVRFSQLTVGAMPPNTQFLAKYDRQGTLLWLQENIGNGQSFLAVGEIGPQVALGPAREVYVAGLFQGSVTLGATTLTNPGFLPAHYLAKLDEQGRFLSARPGLLVQQEAYRDFAVSPAGNFVFACAFEGTAVHGSQRFTSSNGPNPLTLSFSAQGDFLWGQTTSSAAAQGGDQITSVAIDTQGNIYTAHGGRLVVSYSPTGALRWSQSSPLVVTGIAVLAPDQVVITGLYEGRVAFGATALTGVGQVDAFLAKLIGPRLSDSPPTSGPSSPASGPFAGLVPNIITPNQDGQNDYFRVPGLPPALWQFSVYSRWGRLVYRTDNYQQDWSAAGLAAGVYYYRLQSPDQPVLQGWVEVVR